jgi:hypothetical protein
MANDPTDHDCWGCTIRAKLHDALSGRRPDTPIETIVQSILGELTVGEVCQLAGSTLYEWAEDWVEDERPAPRRAGGRRTVEAAGG